MNTRSLLPAILLGATLLGCETETPPPTPDPADAVPSPAPPIEEPQATAPAEEAPLPAVVRMDGDVVEFPPAVLHLLPADEVGEDGGAQTKAVLFSDDPKEAMKPGWDGDSFFFEMTFAGDPAELLLPADDGSLPVWEVYVGTSERQDTRSGLFLDGGRVTLQPVNAEVVLEPDSGAGAAVEVLGTFRRFEGDDRLGELVQVRARVFPDVQVRE